MRGYNDDEVLPLVEYALDRSLDIAFIEEMPLGEASDHDRETDDLRQRLGPRTD